MNDLIVNVINEYFRVYNYCNRLILEAKHIVTTFNDVENFIYEHVKEFPANELIYIGWKFYNDEDICRQSNNEYDKGIPIYVIVEYLSESTFAYIENRNFDDDKIILHINHLSLRDTDLLSKIHHEFVHVKSSFSNKSIDPLRNYKNMYNIENIIYFVNFKDKKYSIVERAGYTQYNLFNYSYFNRAYNALYFISKTEQEARINQIYKYIVTKYNSDTIVNKDMLFKETLNISLLDDFNELVDTCGAWLSDKSNYKLALCIAYYLNDIGYIHYKALTKNTMLKYFNIIDGNKQDIDNSFNMCVNACYDILYKSLTNYEKRVLKIIDAAINDLHENEVK